MPLISTEALNDRFFLSGELTITHKPVKRVQYIYMCVNGS